MPRISVVIAAYNAQRYIGPAIASVQAQTEQDWELIVADDVSTDGTATVVLDLAKSDARIRLVRLEHNGGPGAARNLGLAAARGEWIAILDADDRFDPNRLTRLMVLGEQFGAEMVTDNLLRCCEDDPNYPEAMIPLSIVSKSRLISAREYVLSNIAKRAKPRFGYGFLKPIIRRDFLELYGLRYSEGRFGEDHLFVLECFLHGASLAFTPEPLYLYTIRTGSLTETPSPSDVATLIRIYRQVIASPAAACYPELHDPMRRHLVSTEMSSTWTAFSDALKERQIGGALRIMTRDRHTFVYIAGQAASAFPRFMTKAVKRAVHK